MSKNDLDNRVFSTMLSMWIMQIGLHPQQGVQQILNFLDKKYE
jgi:hypothetical protein